MKLQTSSSYQVTMRSANEIPSVQLCPLSTEPNLRKLELERVFRHVFATLIRQFRWLSCGCSTRSAASKSLTRRNGYNQSLSTQREKLENANCISVILHYLL